MKRQLHSSGLTRVGSGSWTYLLCRSFVSFETRVKEKNHQWKSAKHSTSHAATRTQAPCTGPASVIFPLGLGGMWVSTSAHSSAAKGAGA